MLGGLGALAIPILIHLLLKRKKQRLRFSTLQFFLKRNEQSTRRKFRNWLLLAARILLLTLIALAFARPYLPNQLAANSTQKKRNIVFVLDRSASMQARDGSDSRWNHAKKVIEKLLADLQTEDRVALIGCANHTDILSPLGPPEEIKRVLKNLLPDSGTTDLGNGLQQAVKILSHKNSGEQSIIYLVSDLQRASAKNISSHPVPQFIEVNLLSAAETFTPNLAVTEMALQPKGSTKPSAALANFTDETAKVKTSLFIDNEERFSQHTELKPDESAHLELKLPPLEPGWHQAEIRIRSSDAFALDDSRYEVIHIPSPVRVLVIEPRETKRIFEEESFFVASALEPGKGGRSRFSVEKVSVDQFAKKFFRPEERARFDFVVLPGLREVPSEMARTIAEFVQAGGGLLMFLGDSVSANRYNSEFRELLPAQIGRMEEEPLNWHLADVETTSAIFAAFRQPNSGDLHLPEFTRRFTLDAGPGARVLAKFDDGMPFIVEQTGSKSILVNTSVDTRWNDWPKHKTFVPWLHSVGNYLARNSGLEMKMSSTITASDEVDLDLGLIAKKGAFRVQRAGGGEFTATADEQGRLRNVNLAAPGIYSIRDQSNREVQRVAVNLPSEESDLSALTTNQFPQKIVRGPDAVQPVVAASLFGQQNNQKEFWRVFLMAGLVLLVLELVLANRTFA